MLQPEISEDALLGGRIRVRQPRSGYRVNADTMLLAAACWSLPFHQGVRIAEPGCGVGAALLAIAAKCAKAGIQFVGIERDPTFASLARGNVELNGQAHCARIIEADALAPHPELGVFDHVLFNPPYDNPGEGHAPGEGKRAAFLADRPIGDWIKVWSNRMGGDASMTLIHRAHKLSEILAALEGRLGGVTVFPVRPTAGAEARRVIVRARKGSRAPLKLLTGLDLHPDAASKHKYTLEAEAILRGDTHISLG